MHIQSMLPSLDTVFMTKAFVALVVGFLVGFEREYRAKPAGIKTYAMICLGATIITHVSIQISPYSDPSRIAAQIVSGLGFVGAGAIFQSKRKITGLTTAATLWLMGAMGLLIGTEHFVEAFLCLFLMFIYFLVTELVQATSFKQNKYTTRLIIDDKEKLDLVEGMITKYKLNLLSRSLNKQDVYIFEFMYLCKPTVKDQFVAELLNTAGVHQMTH